MQKRKPQTFWFAVQTKPKQEEKALINLEAQGYVTYLPKIEIRKRRKDGWQQVVEPLFPNYLFLYAAPDQTNLAPVSSTFGVAKLVRFGQLLRPVPEEVIVFLKQQESVSGNVVEVIRPFNYGDKVEILEGPFAGLQAIFQTESSEERIILLLNLMGRRTPVTLHKDEIIAV